MRPRYYQAASIFLFGCWAFFFLASAQEAAASSVSEIAVKTEVKVRHVIDGDTLVLADGRLVRLLGINAPEVARKKRPGEAGGKAAQQWLRKKVQGRAIHLRLDAEKQDKYDRLLAHVFLGKEHINRSLVERGLAVASIIPPNVIYTRALLAAQNKAIAKDKGIWSMPEYQPRPIKGVVESSSKGWQRLVGVPNEIISTKRFVRLKFADNIDVRIPRKSLRYFSDLQAYVGKRIEVRGWVSVRKGYYSVLVRHSSVVVLDP